MAGIRDEGIRTFDVPDPQMEIYEVAVHEPGAAQTSQGMFARVVMVTGSATLDLAEMMYNEGACELVTKPIDHVKFNEWALNHDHVKAVIDGMFGVVNEGGTGVRAQLPNVEVCGKTGTAQLASYDRDTVDNATYAITLEPPGGSPTGQPTSAPIFAGKLIEILPQDAPGSR